MNAFSPDYQYIVDAAHNIAPERMPLYEHAVGQGIMNKVLGQEFGQLLSGDPQDRREYFRRYCQFFLQLGYDTVSFERCISTILPGGGALGGHQTGAIKTRDDFEKYPWESLREKFFQAYGPAFQLLGEQLPPGMKAVGGPGNGVFELVQDLVGYMDLCYVKVDDPDLYARLFVQIGDLMVSIWQEFLQRFGDSYAVLRFGDDLGFKSSTLISVEDIRRHVLPQYARIVELVHKSGKPFLLHSCGDIFPVMDEIIAVTKIDAKHSNEDVIAPFSTWLEKYGDRIGNFGGFDMDVLCQLDEIGIKKYVQEVINYSQGHGGIAFGSGNSIPDYVPVEGYLAMVETVRQARGDAI